MSNPSAPQTEGLLRNLGAFPNSKQKTGGCWVGTFSHASWPNPFVYFNLWRRHFQGVKWSTKESECKIFLSNLYFSSENDYCKRGSSWESSQFIMLDSWVERTLHLGLLNIGIYLPKIKQLEEYKGQRNPLSRRSNPRKMCKAWKKSPWAGRRRGHRMDLTLSIFPMGSLRVSGQQPVEQ